MQRPLAVAITCGLLVQVPLIVVVMPVLPKRLASALISATLDASMDCSARGIDW